MEIETLEQLKEELGESELYAYSGCGEYLYYGDKDLESTITEAFDEVEIYEEDIEEDTEFPSLEIHPCRYITAADISRGHGSGVMGNIKERLEEDFGIEDFSCTEKEENSLGYALQSAIGKWAKHTKILEEKYYITDGKCVDVPYKLAKKIHDNNTVVRVIKT